MKSRWLLSLVALSLVIAACGGNGETTTTTAASGTTTTQGGGDDTTTTTEGSGDIQYDVGVTPAPCDDAVNDGNGCIYLGIISRSEEHTSELQSRPHLVCRLLLEKKNH